MPRAVRGDDHKLFRVQNLLSTITSLVVKATDVLLKAKSDPKRLKIDDLVRRSTDAVALISHSSHEIAQRRREIIKPHDLHRDYIELCSQEVPVTSLLFGDDLQTELTRIRATNKIGNTTNTSHKPSQRRSYKPNTSSYGNKQPRGTARNPVVQTTGTQQQAGSEPCSKPSSF